MKSIHAAAVLVTAIATVGGCGVAGSVPPSSGAPSPTPGAPTIQASPTPPSPTNPEPSIVKAGEWRPAASMLSARTGFDAVLLGDDRVLAVGSDYACFPGGAMPGSEEAEIYDPVDDTWTRVENLNKPRKTPASVVLSDGSVMVIGGLNPDDVPFSSTKIFSPSARTWVDGPLMIVARGTPVAAPLGDGRVIAVDWLGSAERPTSEIYDPARGTWEPGLAFPERVDITALLALAGGSFLAIGDDFSGSDPGHIALTFDGGLEAATRVQSPQGSRYTLLALPDGDALAVGGMDSDLGGDGGTIGWIQRFSVASARWETVATLATPRLASQAVVLGDGRVLIAGGSTGDDFEPATEVLATSEIFDPATDTVEAGPLLLEPRRAGYAVALPDGTVLLVGGDAQLDPGETPFCPTPLKTVERFWPGA